MLGILQRLHDRQRSGEGDDEDCTETLEKAFGAGSKSNSNTPDLTDEELDDLAGELAALLLRAPGGARAGGGAARGEEEDEEDEEDDEVSQRRRAAEAVLARAGAVLSRDTIKRLLAAAMQGAMEDDGDLSSLLTPEERASLERLAAQGRLSHLVPPWQPWWELPEASEISLGNRGQRLISDLGAEAGRPGPGHDGASPEAAPAAVALMPEPPARALPPLSSLSSRRPSPLLRYQAVQLLYAYCFVLRRYNGDVGSSPLEAAEQLLLLAPPLKQQQLPPAELPSSAGPTLDAPLVTSESGSPTAAPKVNPGGAADGSSSGGADAEGHTPGLAPTDAASALRRCALAACTPPAGGPELRPLALAAVGDAARLLQLGRPALVLAITDLGRRVAACGAAAAAARDAAPPGLVRAAAARLRKRLKAAAQKLLFFASWANEQLPEVWEALGAVAAAEHAQHLREAEAQRRMRPGGAQGPAGVLGGSGGGGEGAVPEAAMLLPPRRPTDAAAAGTRGAPAPARVAEVWEPRQGAAAPVTSSPGDPGEVQGGTLWAGGPDGSAQLSPPPPPPLQQDQEQERQEPKPGKADAADGTAAASASPIAGPPAAVTAAAVAAAAAPPAPSAAEAAGDGAEDGPGSPSGRQAAGGRAEGEQPAAPALAMDLFGLD